MGGLRGKLDSLGDLLITGLEGLSLSDDITYRPHSLIWTQLWGTLDNQSEMELEVQLRERLIEDIRSANGQGIKSAMVSPK